MAEGEDKESKNLPASAKKRQQLREHGNVVKSQDVGATVLLAAAITMLLVMGKYYATSFADLMQQSFVEIEKVDPNSMGLIHNTVLLKPDIILYQTLFWMALLLLIVVAQISQVGFHLSTKALKLRFQALDPVKGLKKLFSIRKVVELVLNIAKMSLIIGLTFSAFFTLKDSDVFTRMVTPMEYGTFLVQVVWEIGWRVLLALIFIAIIDYTYQKMKFEKDNRMSRQDMKEEMKQAEGNPEVKKKVRQKMYMSLRRMLENMADTTIVITNPTHFAVALKYRKGETDAPVVMAKGMDRIAFKIKDKAIDFHIPIVENKPLARGLYKDTQIGEMIPAIYYRAVAMVIAGLKSEGYQIDEQREANL